MLSLSLFSASRGRSRSSTFLRREYHSAQLGCDNFNLSSVEEPARSAGAARAAPSLQARAFRDSRTPRSRPTRRGSVRPVEYGAGMRTFNAIHTCVNMRERDVDVYEPRLPTPWQRPSSPSDRNRSAAQRRPANPSLPSCGMGGRRGKFGMRASWTILRVHAYRNSAWRPGI